MSRVNKQAPTTKVAVNTKQATLSWKERLHPEDYESLRNTFDLFDEDHSGYIDPEEISKIMEELGESRKNGFIYHVIDSLRVKEKPINFEEFVSMVAFKCGDVKTKDGIRTIFKHLDTDDDDYINYDEIKKISRFAGDTINDDEILELLHSIHINHKTNTNEGLTFEEFYHLIITYNKKHSQ